MWHSHQPFVEPSHDIVEPFDAMPGLARARKLVRLAGEYDHSSWALQKLECAEQLLSTRVLRSAVIGLAQNEHHGGVDFLDECNCRAVGIVLRVLKGRCLEPTRLEQSKV